MNHQKRCKTAGLPPNLLIRNEDGILVEKPADKDCRLLGSNILRSDLEGAPTDRGEAADTCREETNRYPQTSLQEYSVYQSKDSSGRTCAKPDQIFNWGGTTGNMIKKIQILINKAARCVTGQGRRISTIFLMEQTGWLTAKELVSYFTLVETWKNVRQNISPYMAGKLEMADDKLIVRETRLIMTKASYRWRARAQGNQVSSDIQECLSLPLFKKKVKNWLKMQRFPVVDDQRPQDAEAWDLECRLTSPELLRWTIRARRRPTCIQ